MAYNTVYVWAAYETLGSTNLNSNFANLGYLKTKADKETWICPIFYPSQALTTGDGKYAIVIPSWMDGYNVSAVEAYTWTPSSSGVITLQLRNATQGYDILSPALTIDANENDSSTAATPAVINTSNDTVNAFDELYWDVDTIGTGAAGLIAFPSFYLS